MKLSTSYLFDDHDVPCYLICAGIVHVANQCNEFVNCILVPPRQQSLVFFIFAELLFK